MGTQGLFAIAVCLAAVTKERTFGRHSRGVSTLMAIEVKLEDEQGKEFGATGIQLDPCSARRALAKSRAFE